MNWSDKYLTEFEQDFGKFYENWPAFQRKLKEFNAEAEAYFIDILDYYLYFQITKIKFLLDNRNLSEC